MKTTTIERSAAEDRRILIVDDEDFVRAVFQEQLGEHYERFTAAAANAQEALQCMSERPFALVITDVQMPGLSGIDLMRKILEDFSGVAVIISSGACTMKRWPHWANWRSAVRWSTTKPTKRVTSSN